MSDGDGSKRPDEKMVRLVEISNCLKIASNVFRHASAPATSRNMRMVLNSKGPMMPISFEMTLDELLADPIIQLLMRQDGVAESDMRALMAGVGAALAARRWPV